MFRWVEHTGELELDVEAESEEGVLAEAASALAEILSDSTEGKGERLRQTVVVEAPDPAALLAAWLEELVFLSETQGFVPERLVELELDDGALSAVVEGRRGEPRTLVKAVTFHRLRLAREGVRWYGRVVFDV